MGIGGAFGQIAGQIICHARRVRRIGEPAHLGQDLRPSGIGFGRPFEFDRRIDIRQRRLVLAPHGVQCAAQGQEAGLVRPLFDQAVGRLDQPFDPPRDLRIIQFPQTLRPGDPDFRIAARHRSHRGPFRRNIGGSDIAWNVARRIAHADGIPVQRQRTLEAGARNHALGHVAIAENFGAGTAFGQKIGRMLGRGHRSTHPIGNIPPGGAATVGIELPIGRGGVDFQRRAIPFDGERLADHPLEPQMADAGFLVEIVGCIVDEAFEQVLAELLRMSKGHASIGFAGFRRHPRRQNTAGLKLEIDQRGHVDAARQIVGDPVSAVGEPGPALFHGHEFGPVLAQWQGIAEIGHFADGRQTTAGRRPV